MDNKWSPDMRRKSSSMKEKGQDKQTYGPGKIWWEHLNKETLINICREILKDITSIKPEQDSMKK
jgi:hypothetical protein